MIYTTAHWWNTCTGDSGAFATDHALWIARHGSPDVGKPPTGWPYRTFWQYGNSGSLPGDQNLIQRVIGPAEVVRPGRPVKGRLGRRS